MVLENAPEQELAAYADLAVYTRHATRSLVRSIHQGIVKPKPIVERVRSIDTLELLETVACLCSVTQLRLVLGADMDASREDVQEDKGGAATGRGKTR